MSGVEKVQKARAKRAEDFGLTVVDGKEAAPAPPAFHRCPDLVATIIARSLEGICSLTLGGEEVIRLRPGATAVATGAPGSGKTSMAIGMTLEHARERGIVVFVSAEMDGDELAARAIGMQCEASWEDVLCGRVREEFMHDALDLPRLVVLDGDNATIEHAALTVAALREQFPDVPVFVVFDYIQIIQAVTERDLRARVAATAQAIRRFAKLHRVIVLAISQPSRAAGKALSAGELLGVDSMTAMAETAEIERMAYYTLALGSPSPVRDDGTSHVDLSIGKGRFGGGDRVIPLAFNGRTGRMRIAGEARAAADVRAERADAKDREKVEKARVLAVAKADSAKAPLTREELARLIGGSAPLARAGIKAAEVAGEIVEVQRKVPRARNWKLWTPDRASAAGIPLVEDADA